MECHEATDASAGLAMSDKTQNNDRSRLDRECLAFVCIVIVLVDDEYVIRIMSKWIALISM